MGGLCNVVLASVFKKQLKFLAVNYRYFRYLLKTEKYFLIKNKKILY